VNNYDYLASIVDGWISSLVFSSSGSAVLDAACSYSAKSHGKRFRSVLSLMTAEMLGLDTVRLKSFCLALELLHVSTLIHDDLPALDNDDLRRGSPSCHKKFDESVAVLTGDSLLAKSFEVILSDESLDDSICRLLVNQMTLVIDAICAGQVVDIKGPTFTFGEELPEQDLLVYLKHRDELKTGSLINLAVLGAAIIGGLSRDSTDVLGLLRFSSLLGVLYQVTDDLLESSSCTEIAGKDVFSDAKKGKITYSSVLGVPRARTMAGDLMIAIEESLSVFGSRADLLEDLSRGLLDRNR